ncbi:MAG: hypothetical protein Ta2D_07650 [Rickettsiales bacterium]|nr:MAG: hypothetical protein Ta2D_07650 [Rickettsiales bacterium]
MLKDNKGFSTIELIVVLLVSSLLIAGVTSSFYLMKNSILRATMRDITTYKTAIFTYYENLDKMPGDDAKEFKFENSCHAWTNLQNENLILTTRKLEDCETLFLNPRFNIHSKIKNTWFALGKRNAGNTEFAEFNKNSIALFGGRGDISFDDAESSLTFKKENLALSLKDALYIDKKLDDGNLDTGTIIGVGIDNDSCGGIGERGNVNSNELACVLFFDLGF